MLLRKSVKFLGLFWLVLFAFSANATNYYLSNSGNDANSGTDPSTPWQTLNKLNSFKNLKPGDSVLFKRGETFYGSITVNNSGTAGNPITYSAYGSGEKPVITGFTNVTDWKNVGNNIWQSTNAVSKLSTCNMVVINGVNTAMGRWPNSGYLTYETFNGDTSITSSSLTGNTNWTNAEVVIRKNHYIIDRNRISSDFGKTLNYESSSSPYSNTNGFGFFIQNDSRTLDSTNEWYYSPSSKTLRVYSTNIPTDVHVATLDTLLFLTSKTNITFNGISFTGANNCAMYFWIASDITIKNCNFNFSGLNAIEAYLCSNVFVQKNYINNTNNNAIRFTSWDYEPVPTNHITISEDTIKNTSALVGMGNRSDEQIDRTAILVQGSNSTIRNCVIDSTGYIPIWWRGSSFLVENNLITNFCFIKDDGGAIWTFNNDKNPPVYTNQTVSKNIILNGIGALDGSVADKFTSASGIYCDGNTSNIEISGNTVSNCNRSGILIHDAHEIVIRNNTLYNNGFQITLYSDNDFTDDPDSVSLIRNLDIKKNVFFAKDSGQMALSAVAFFDDIKNFGDIDSNYYVRPIDDNLTFEITSPSSSLLPIKKSLSGWQTYSAFDASSKKSPKTIFDNSDLRFEYNSDSISKTISLPYPYIDVKGTNYEGSITVYPFESVVLIKKELPKNQTPQAEAGSNMSITLPVNKVTLSGSGKNCYSYLWTKISGPASYSILNAASAITDVTELTEGVYLFELKVTDSIGATAKDTVTITVNSAENILLKANAGLDKTITLPVNTTILTGSATDSDGYISNYLWERISGPSDCSIENTHSAITTVTGLTEGVYQFQLSVKDDKGGSASSMVQITVNAPLNIAPTATSDADQTITLPTNAATVSGSGFDSDGTISAYFWSKIAGPPAYIISNPSSSVTTVSGLVQGVYEFELNVTDDKGAIGKDTVQITVNPSPNIAPTANAGVDKTIALPTNSVSLSGSGMHSDGSISSYLWTKISGPSAFNIASSSAAATTVSGLVQGTYQFELKVTDNNGVSGNDTVQVTVNAAANLAPTANAGVDKTITLPTNSISLSGSGTDPDGTISSYSWTKISGPSGYSISSSSSAVTAVSGLVQGVYLFELKVTDDKGAIGKDTIQATVNAAPTANASADKTITLPTNSVSLLGSASDSHGSISSYSWVKISGPSAYNISSPSAAVTTVSGLVQGVYLFEFTVADDKGSFGKDTVQVTVNAAPNIAPTANAGKSQTIMLPINSVTLAGSGSDYAGTISSYSWTKISGPNAGTISDSSSAITTVKGLIKGTYVFRLTVTDNSGATGTDSIDVTVNAPKNNSPTANAGRDLTVVLPVNTVYLNGNGNDTDGTITAYYWKQIAGPDSASITAANEASTLVNNLVDGTYEFELTVTDNDGEKGKDTVTVVVALARMSGETKNIKIYPNPVKDIATIEVTSESVNSKLTFIIFDFSGKKVYKKQIVSPDYKMTEKINMSRFSKGSYAVSVFFDGKDKQVLTIIKQ